jgi:hypothetical protein
VPTLTAQRTCKKIIPVGVGILALGGCIPGYQDTPIPPCFFADDPDPACQSGQGAEGSGTGGGVPTTGTAFPGDGSGSDDSEGQGPGDGTDTSEVDAETTTGSGGSESSGSVAEPVPEIVDLDLDPFAPKSAGPVKVTVQADNAVEVWMTVDDGGEVALEPVGDEGTEFVGEIAVLGESWNGLHTVSAVAWAGELESLPWEEMFTVTAPTAGTEAWKKKSTLTPSYGNAVAVDAQGEIYELLTFIGNAGGRCHVRRRDVHGDSVWPQDTVELAAGVYCVGEAIKVAPNGTLWVLVNTKEANIWQWQLYHLDVDGSLLGAPDVSDGNEMGHGLDVNEDGDVLTCGTGPGVDLPDAWIKLSPVVGTGWTVPWVYEFGSEPFDERTKDCAFVGDRIVAVGEAFGRHDQNQLWTTSRGFVAEFGINGVELTHDVATDLQSLQSGHEAVAPDGVGGYMAVGYTCDAEMVPCSPTVGAMKWFSLNAELVLEQPAAKTSRVWDVAANPTGGMVVAAQALDNAQGFLVQAWGPGLVDPSWEYQGVLSDYQVATGVAVGPYGYIAAGGYYLADNILAAGVVRLHPY